jgi:hypothetical protein
MKTCTQILKTQLQIVKTQVQKHKFIFLKSQNTKDETQSRIVGINPPKHHKKN